MHAGIHAHTHAHYMEQIHVCTQQIHVCTHILAPSPPHIMILHIFAHALQKHASQAVMHMCENIYP